MNHHLTRRLLCTLLLSATGLAASAQQLTVSAAASLTNVLKDLAPRYEASHPGAKLQFNFAASGVLIQQIAQGAPVDVFISADEETMAKGMAQKLLDPASRRDIASNQVVLIVPMVSDAKVAALADLNAPAVQHIALGKLTSVPVGRYTRQALDKAQLWSVLEPKFVYADSVRQVLDYVARGEAEAGFVYSTDAAVMPDKVRVVTRVDGHAPVRYPAAITSEGRQKTAASDFVAFLLSTPAQEALAKAGFGKP
jgi:molybdate transport system substrate-binding protein